MRRKIPRLRRLLRCEDSGVRLAHDTITELGSFLSHRRAKGYMVGGFIRDMLTGARPHDLDIAVEGIEPRLVANHLHRTLGFSRPVLFRRFNSTFVVRDGFEVEVSPLGRSLEEDCRRRDFTVNCLYAPIPAVASSSGALSVLDPTGRGMRDLAARRLRTPVTPSVTLWLDPVRMLRAVRFVAVHGFSLDGDLRDCTSRMVYLLGRVAAERVRAELEKVLVSNRLTSALRLMQRLGIVEVVLPELGRVAGFAQSTPYHAYDLLTHSIKTAAGTPRDLQLRLAGLLHDLGKIDTRADSGGRVVYYGHQDVSADIAGAALRRLRFSNRVVGDVTFLIRNHMINYSKAWSDKAVRRFVRKMGGRLDMMLSLVASDRRAQRPEKGMADNIAELRGRIRGLTRRGRIHFELPVDGNDIMELLGIKEGPAVGRARDFLINEATKRPNPLTRSDCQVLLRSWANKHDLPGVIGVDKTGGA